MTVARHHSGSANKRREGIGREGPRMWGGTHGKARELTGREIGDGWCDRIWGRKGDGGSRMLRRRERKHWVERGEVTPMAVMAWAEEQQRRSNPTRKTFGSSDVFNRIQRNEEDSNCGDLGLRKSWTTREKRTHVELLNSLGMRVPSGAQRHCVAGLDTDRIGRKREIGERR